MLESAYLFVGFVAVLTTVLAASTQTRLAAGYGDYADPAAMVAGLLGTISWWMLAYGSLNVEVVGDSVTYTFSMAPITVWCLAFSIVPLIIALTGPLEVVKGAVSPREAEV